MSVIFGWDKVLKETNSRLGEELGVDLNQDGVVTQNESADANGDKRITEEESRDYCIRHQRELASLSPILRAAISSGFELTNPIHNTMVREYSIEGNGHASDTLLEAYGNLRTIYTNYMAILESHAVDGVLSAAPNELMEWLTDAMIESGAQFASTGSALFLHDLSRNMYDCDTSTRILTAIADKFNWPIHAVGLPGHIFARWQLNENQFINFEVQQGAEEQYGTHFLSNSFYKNWKNLDRTSIDNGSYLSNMTPEEWEMWDLFNIAYSRLGQYTNTIDGLGSATQIEDLTRQSLADIEKIGRSQINLGTVNDSIVFMERGVLPAAGRAPAVYALLEIAYTIKGYATGDNANYETAIDYASRQIELDPSVNTLATRLNRAQLYEETGNYEAALDDWDSVIAEMPLPEYFARRQAALMNLGYYEAAGIDMGRLVSASRNRPNVSIGSGSAAGDDVAPREGLPITEATPIDKMDDWDRMSFYDRGMAYIMFGNYEKAKNIFLQGLAVNPEDPQILSGLAKVELELHRYGLAANYSSRAIANDEDCAMAREVRAEAHYHMARDGRTVGDMQNYYEGIIYDSSYTSTAESYIIAGYATEQLGDIDGARKYYETALEADPENVEALAQLGLFEARHGDFMHPATGDLGRGHDAAFKALVLNPDNKTALLACALISQRTGYFAEAVRFSQVLIDKNPGDGEAVRIRDESQAALAAR